MTIEPLSDLFEGKGVLVRSAGESVRDLDYSKVVALFETHGVVVFRGFDLTGPTLSSVTDVYTEKYARDAMRREQRFDDKVVRNVDLGTDAHTLHSEASYSPAWPEIVWFFCTIPAEQGGATTLCDGQRLWKELSTSTKNFFMREPLRFDLEIPVGDPRPGKGRQAWMFETPGATGEMDWETGSLIMTQLRFAMQENRAGNALCFCNHLHAELGKDKQIKNQAMMLAGGTVVPDAIMDEMREKSARLTYDHQWETHDLVMVDNKRVMHGRRSYSGKRDVVNVQTGRASFGWGATLRHRIREAKAVNPV